MPRNMDSATAENIEKAQTVRRRPPSSPLVDEANIHGVLAGRATKTPDETFLVSDDMAGGRREFTCKQFHDRVMQLARFMHEKLGVRRGDRVGTLSQNVPETVLIYFAAWTIGAVVVPQNPGEDDERIVFSLENARAKYLFVHADFSRRAAALLKRLPRVKERVLACAPRNRKGWLRLEEAFGLDANWAPRRAAQRDDEALIVYTSGTTGAPKGVLLTQYNLLVDADSIARWHALGPGDRGMCVLPIHHVNGTVVTLLTPLYCGASVVLCRRFSPRGFWKRIRAEGITFCSVVPTLLEYLYESRERPSRAKDVRFRHFICGAGPLTVDLATRFEERFGYRIVHGYGLSETTCYSCFLPIDLPDREHEKWMRGYGYPSIGVPVRANEMAIHDENGRSVGQGKRGEIVIRGHNVMKAYYARPDANRETFKHGWFRSGDEGFSLTDDRRRKFFFITGRIKELIIRGGINISTLELDEALMKIPGVRCGLAVGFENKYYGEEVGAYIVPDGTRKLGEKTIIDAMAKDFPFSKRPKVVVFGTDVPVTSTGKYQRIKLQTLFENWRDTQFRA